MSSKALGSTFSFAGQLPWRVLGLQGDLVDSNEGALRRVLLGLTVQCVLRRKARQTLPPIQEWRRFDVADVQPGLFWCKDLREAPGTRCCKALGHETGASSCLLSSLRRRCHKDALCVGVDVVRCRRNGQRPSAHPVPGGRR